MSVLKLSDFRKKPKEEPVIKGPEKNRLYFCTQCKSELFRIDLDGEVWCRCGSWIKNLKAELV